MEKYYQTCGAFCYQTNNRYAYQQDRYGRGYENEIKIYNFVPTYDKWCLYCDKTDCKLRCSRCKTIYFCDEKCRDQAWPIHKKHCGRNQFTLCAFCGDSNLTIKCDNCPVSYCSQECKDEMHQQHLDYDCDYFAKHFFRKKV